MLAQRSASYLIRHARPIPELAQRAGVTLRFGTVRRVKVVSFPKDLEREVGKGPPETLTAGRTASRLVLPQIV